MVLELETPPGVLLRRSQAGDYEFARTLYIESTKPLLRALDRWDEARLVARFTKSFQRGEAQVICADGVDIGWLQVSVSSDGLHLHQMHLRDPYRNRGIGSRLICSVMEQARGSRMPVTLNVIRGNPAISLYLRLGFRVVDEETELLRMRWNPAPETAR
jgi:GNAT superfamily N-acetyltransferase